MSARDTDELLAAYVDGVGELTSDERRRVEARLAEADGFRDDAAATRSLIGALRELPPEGREPDWSAMERAIRAEVGPSVPRSWWRGWRGALVPVGALAAAGAIWALVLRTPDPIDDTVPVVQTTPVAVRAVDAGSALPPGESEPEIVALWLDGAEVEVELDAGDVSATELLELDAPSPEDAATGLLPAQDLAWVDELGDDDMAAAEAWLARKKS